MKEMTINDLNHEFKKIENKGLGVGLCSKKTGSGFTLSQGQSQLSVHKIINKTFESLYGQ